MPTMQEHKKDGCGDGTVLYVDGGGGDMNLHV